MKRARIVYFIIAFLAFLTSIALANGLNLNSIGSKALAMGGAFVGLADDFSTIYWNPAGIAQFNKQYFGFYGVDILPSGTYKLSTNIPGIGEIPLVNAKTERKHYLAGMVAYYYPVSENMVAGFGIYTPSGLGANWDGADFAMIANYNSDLKWTSKIGVITFAPAIAYKVNDQISFGVALNINYGTFDVAMHAGATEPPLPVVDLAQYEETMNGWGYGATLGVLYKATDKISVGATFRTPSTVKFSGEATISNLPLVGGNSTTDLDREVTWPMWLAGGVAFRPLDKLVLTADLQWTQWSKINVIETTYKDPFWALMMEASEDDKRPMYWNDKIQIRLGAEYWIDNIAFRAGYYYDPSPAPDKTMNVLLPNYDFHALAAGVGYNLNGLQIEFSVEYLIGKERNVDSAKVQFDPEWASAMPGTYSQNILAPNISVSYKF